MKIKRRTIITLSVLVFVLGGFALLRRPVAEPRYRDIPLSTWLALHRSYQFRNLTHVVLLGDRRDELPDLDTLGPFAPHAIKQIGTNALPSLISWLSQPENAWKRKLTGVIEKLPSPVRPDKVPVWLDYRRDYERASLAFTGFGILKAEAAPAIAALTRIALDTNALGAASAIGVLVSIGKPAVPVLAGLLSTNATRATQVEVMNGLGHLGPNAADAVPVLVLCLNSPDEGIAKSAAWALGRIARRSEIAVPALVRSLDDSRYAVRLAAAKALGDFGGDALPARRSLSNLVSQPDVKLSQEAEKALLKISSASSGEPFRPEPGALWDIFPALR
jgi:hypothetical protein